MPIHQTVRFILVLLFTWVNALTAFADQRLALVIGNDQYQKVGALNNARADAKAVAAKLQSLGFDVTLQLDADGKAMFRAMRQFKSRIQGGDVVVFYFSGHGVQLEAANYLLPVDIAAENVDQVKDDALALQRVLDDFRDQKARFSLAILDACRDNPFKGRGRAIGGRGLAPITAANGQMVLFSAGAGQQALDRLSNKDTKPNGLFTRVLLQEMDQPGVSIDRALRKVRDEVVRLAQSVGHDQVPALYDQTTGDFFFRPGKTAFDVVTAQALGTGSSKDVVSTLKPGAVLRDCEGCPEIIVIPGGSYEMGSTSFDSEREKYEMPIHRVTIPSFAMAKTELTRAQFAAFVQDTGYVSTSTGMRSKIVADAATGKQEDTTQNAPVCGTYENGGRRRVFERDWQSPGFVQDETHPVVCVSWFDAKAYLDWLSRKTGKTYRLPSEAEWEYAARANTTTARYWGKDSTQACAYANVADQTFQRETKEAKKVMHACQDGFVYTAPVAHFKPNALGLFDMLGNVEEWVEDCWNPSYVDAPRDGSAEPRAKDNTLCRTVIRGGSWLGEPANVRSVRRSDEYPVEGLSFVGFRVVRNLP